MRKRSIIITLAGRSQRFAESVGYPCHKSLYRAPGDNMTILGYQLDALAEVGATEFILVGGYRYDDVEEYARSYAGHLPIRLVRNEHFEDYGSCYSLVLGIDATDITSDELLFFEGDLVVDADGIRQLLCTAGDAVTAQRNVIDAAASVAFYITPAGRLHYIYDTHHNALCVTEPFRRMANSGQIWKFGDIPRLKQCVAGYSTREWKDTNLRPICDYYNGRDCTHIPIVTFNVWYNCNTLTDWLTMRKAVSPRTRATSQH